MNLDLSNTSNSSLFSLVEPEYFELRRKREEFSLEFRSVHRQDLLKKKRNTYILPYSDVASGGSLDKLQTHLEYFASKDFSIEDLPKLVEFSKSDNVLEQHFACLGIRKLLSFEVGSPIQQIIDSGLVPVLIANLAKDESPFLQRDCAWALTNIAAGSTKQTEIILSLGALKPMMNLLNSNEEELAEQAIWAIGNIAGDNAGFRDQILDIGIDELVKIGLATKNQSLFKNVTWALSNLSRGRPAPLYEKVKEAGKVFAEAIRRNTKEEEILVDSLWALSCISDGKDDQIQNVVDLGIIPYVLEFLKSHQNLGILIPSIRIVGNIISGNENQTEEIMKHNPLDLFMMLLHHPKKTVRREICWILSNVVATNIETADQVLKHEKLLQLLFKLVETDCTDIKKEILYVFSNICNNGILEQIQILVDHSVIQIYLGFMEEFKEVKTLMNIMEGLFLLMKKGDTIKDSEENPYIRIFEESQGIKRLEAIQKHPSKTVFKKSTEILEYFYEYQSES